MKTSELIKKLDLKVYSEGEDKEITGCYIGDLLSLAMSRVSSGNIWITIQTNINTVAVAGLTDGACILLVEGLQPDENTLKKAALEEIYILSTEKSAYDTAKEIAALI